MYFIIHLQPIALQDITSQFRVFKNFFKSIKIKLFNEFIVIASFQIFARNLSTRWEKVTKLSTTYVVNGEIRK